MAFQRHVDAVAKLSTEELVKFTAELNAYLSKRCQLWYVLHVYLKNTHLLLDHNTWADEGTVRTMLLATVLLLRGMQALVKSDAIERWLLSVLRFVDAKNLANKPIETIQLVQLHDKLVEHMGAWGQYVGVVDIQGITDVLDSCSDVSSLDLALIRRVDDAIEDRLFLKSNGTVQKVESFSSNHVGLTCNAASTM